MNTLHFSTLIHAPRAVVWDKMLDLASYQVWAAAFFPGSYFEGSWEQGARIRFLAPGGGGMLSEIAENRPHEFISIKHLGMINNGVEDTESEDARKWASAYENYTFVAVGEDTELQVALDTVEEYEQYMRDTWPKALAELKTLCETA